MAGRKSVGRGSVRQVHMQVSGDLLRRIDAFAEKLARETPGLVVSRADVVRQALYKFLAKDKMSAK